MDRPNDSTSYRTVKIQEPAYFDRLQRIIWLALYVKVQVGSQQTAALAVYAVMFLHTLRADDLDRGVASEDDAKFEELCDLCAERVSRLKALTSAWEKFCAGLGVAASDLDKMIGLPFLGSGGTLDLTEEIMGEVAPDMEYQRDCLDHMKAFWKTKLEDRYAA